jgi:hypothetical protein
MLLRIWEKAKDPLRAVLCLAALANLDRSYFFPLSAHTDLRFQAVGESLELLALIGILITVRVAAVGEDPKNPTFRMRLLMGAFVVLLLFVMFWRDFFPNDRFSLQAGAMDFFYAPLAGLAIFALTFLSSSPAKASKEREAPVI